MTDPGEPELAHAGAEATPPEAVPATTDEGPPQPIEGPPQPIEGLS